MTAPPEAPAAGTPPAPPDALAALDALDVGVACVTPDWRLAYVNAAWLDAVGGLDPADYVGRDYWAAFPALADTPEAAIIRATAADGVPRAFRIRYQDARIDGTFDVRVRRAVGGGGLVFAVHNVTAQERLEQVHDRLLESIGEGLFVISREWTVRYANAAAERISGQPRDRVLGRSVWEAYPSLAGSPFEEIWRDVMRARRGRRARTVPVRRRNGLTALFDAQVYPVADGGLLVLFSEVSQRERQARALAERSAENERLRDLARTMAAVGDTPTLLAALCDAATTLTGADGAAVAAVSADGEGPPEGTVIAVANHPAEVRGHRFPLAGTLTGRLVALLAAPPAEGAASDDARVPLLRAAAAEGQDAAYRGTLADGRRVGAALLAPLAAHGRTLGVLSVSRAEGEPPFSAADEDRLRVVADHASLALYKAALVEEAQAANSTKSAFLATVSHELRTPLTALTGYGELLADEIAGPLTLGQADIVERMRAVTHQLTGMIEEVLTFSALEAGREVVRPAPVDVAEVVQAVVAVVEPLAQHKGLAFRASVPPVPPPLTTDPDKLRQILVNLAGNAVKFTSAGEVAVVVDADDDAVRVTVADTGIGIADHDVPRLFQAFSQLDRGLTRRFGGTGLGLYISQRLARLLGGHIAVASAPGAGSTFTLTLPLAAPAPPAGGAEAAATFRP